YVDHRDLHSFPTRRSSDLQMTSPQHRIFVSHSHLDNDFGTRLTQDLRRVLNDESAVFYDVLGGLHGGETWWEKIVEELSARDVRSEEHTSELQSLAYLVCR